MLGQNPKLLYSHNSSSKKHLSHPWLYLLCFIVLQCAFIDISYSHHPLDMQKTYFSIYGFHKFYLKQEMPQSIENLQKIYGIKIFENETESLITPFNPYLLLAQKTNLTYSNQGVPFTHNGQLFYIPIDAILLNQPELKEVQFFQSKDELLIKHFQLKTIHLSQQRNLSKIHPALRTLKLMYFKKHLYSIHLSMKLKWKDIRNHYLKFVNQLGHPNHFTQPGLKDSVPSQFISIQSDKYKFIWQNKDVNVRLEIKDDSKKTLHTHSNKDKNTEETTIYITITDHQLNKAHESYLERLNEDITLYILEEAERKKNTILKLKQIQKLNQP